MRYKYVLGRINHKLEIAEERISELEEIAIETIPMKQRRNAFFKKIKRISMRYQTT